MSHADTVGVVIARTGDEGADMLMPSLSLCMTPQPWTIRKDACIAEARRLMREHEIRHLPVLEAGKLVGVVSDRDLQFIESLRATEREDLTVEEAMVQDVYTASVEAPVDEVVEHMARSKLGSTIALDRHGKVKGIFTTVDAMQFLANMLRRVTA